MRLFLLGVSHQTAPVDLREKLDFSSRDVGAAVEALASRQSAAESVVLSTCNRSEVYVVAEDAARAHAEIVEFLSSYHALPAETFVPHLFARDDNGVVQHLFRVAAGLDSIVVGEPQVLGQVKQAYQVAADRHCVGPLLTKLFQSSFAVGKRVRTETTLGEGAVSIGFAAVALARKIFGRLEGRQVLVIGAGEISTLAAQHFRSQGVGEIVVASRTTAHAQTLAEAVSGRAVPWDGLRGALFSADIVITATGSQRPILTRDAVAAATGRRRPGPLFIVDLAVPRDVDPAVGEIEQVFLYNVDDLQTVVHENVSKRGAEIAKAETIVNEEVARFTAWRRSRSVVPTVVALRQRFETIRRGELQRLQTKLAGLSPQALERVDEITRLMIEKLLLDPTEQLKNLPDQDTQVAYTEMMNRLFRLRGDDAAATTDADEAPASHLPAPRPRQQ
jgi:glutamyl-tRNA reductase